ncbi:AAA family ATPase [uncultured Fluviicola sp.]|uniref:AAA family ATPase n=1 Tax=uncultured Fluviicola sp. TaxID=463303 RepID=UPI0025DA2A71|nr:AAA family ATPase [uncultured Fluviicola sp.]
MNGFKLLAIRALGETPDYILKGLKKDILYKFYQNYQFISPSDFNVNGSDAITSIVCDGGIPELLYSSKKPYISISAVVGKNGSGKSSLNELIYLFNFLISASNELEMIKETDPITRGYFSKIEKPVAYTDIEQLQYIFKHTHIDLFYELYGMFYRMTYRYGAVENECLSPHIKEEKTSNTPLDEKSLKRKKLLTDFHYTVAVNYSLYGLSGGTDMWLNPLFHKNDGYQIPIVINPYREDGGINVNSERHLAQSRLLSNIVDNLNSTPIIVSKKKIEKIELLIVPEEFDSIWHMPMNRILKKLNDRHKLDMFSFFNLISKSIIGKILLSSQAVSELKSFLDELKKDSKSKYLRQEYDTEISTLQIKYFLVKYVVRKVFKICIQQREYSSKFLENDLSKEIKEPFSLKNLKKLGKALADDKSHVTLKLKQALNSISASCFFGNWERSINPRNPEHIAFKTTIMFDMYRDAVEEIRKNNSSLSKESLEAIPNAMYKPTIMVKDSEVDRAESSFDKLSSGEQQFIHTFQTAIYHLRNLNSVHNCGDNTKIAYKYVNLIFDEIELCFHPEFQRTFIHELLKGIKRTKLPKIEGINIIFSTHSPFILSDIPMQNVLRLKKGLPDSTPTINSKTFGANIHELLHNDFFLDKSFIGEWARLEILSVANYLTGKKKECKLNDNELQSFISMIGEPLIQIRLQELLEIKKGKISKSSMLNRIKELEKENHLLKSRDQNATNKN